ncbi:hypothetical protein B0H13DRAFT_2533119 [Mycena leptocephala]|nr:hypothetical protein B0H13DRAFT_2533119 [Mycena leptocephala]
MSQICTDNPNIVTIAPVVAKPPANPLFFLENISRTPVPSLRPASSINTENSATRRVLANRVLFYDQRCFLTGSVSPETQACHLINTIRPKGKERKKRLKEQIEFILTRQGFNGQRAFCLDSVINVLALDVHWHRQLDKRGSFCVVVPLTQIQQIRAFLSDHNTAWARRSYLDPGAPRNLDTTIDPFVVKTCVVLVLRPHLFLPDNKPILINTKRALRACGGPLPPASAPTSWVPHYIQEGNPFLVDNSGNKLLTLPFTTNRTADNTLSIFCLLINAYYKITSLPVEPRFPLEVYDFLAELETLFYLIFYIPPGSPPGPFPSGFELPLPTSDHAQWPVQSGDSMDLDSHDSNPNRLEIDSNFDSAGGGQYMDDCEEDSEADDSESGSEDEDAETERRHRAITRAFDGSAPIYDPISPLLAGA